MSIFTRVGTTAKATRSRAAALRHTLRNVGAAPAGVVSELHQGLLNLFDAVSRGFFGIVGIQHVETVEHQPVG